MQWLRIYREIHRKGTHDPYPSADQVRNVVNESVAIAARAGIVDVPGSGCAVEGRVLKESLLPMVSDVERIQIHAGSLTEQVY